MKLTFLGRIALTIGQAHSYAMPAARGGMTFEARSIVLIEVMQRKPIQLVLQQELRFSTVTEI